jgi:hypothetical protein
LRVRTKSGIYRDWISVTVEQSFRSAGGNAGIPRVFRLQVAEPDTKVLRLKPEDRVDIALAGKVVSRKATSLPDRLGTTTSATASSLTCTRRTARSRRPQS